MPKKPARRLKKVLVIDVGGTNLKFLATGQREPRKVPSGKDLSARDMARAVRDTVSDWEYDVISLGFPGPVVKGRPLQEPVNLGKGWVSFDYEKHLGRPVKIINDAAMQAVGSYEGGRMLFLGLGTGLGTTLIHDSTVSPMELGHLPYKNGKSFEEYVGAAGLKRHGKKRWEAFVHDIVARLRAALVADYVVLGGGNARKLKLIPDFARLGSNRNAFLGGFRLWRENHWKGL